MRQKLYVFSLYLNPDLDEWIFYCLLASMAAVLAEDVRASFLFVGDLNGHHQKWLNSTTTNRHGVAASDFATGTGCDQLVVGPTHARGETLDLLMTNVPDLVRVPVRASIGNSDHSSLSAVISMAQTVQNLCLSHKVFLKHQVAWTTVCGSLRDLPWHNIWLSDNPVEVLMNNCPCWLHVMYQSRSSMCVTRLSLRLIINAGILLVLSRRLIFIGDVITLGLTGKSLYAVKLELMKPTQRPRVSFVTETGMF